MVHIHVLHKLNVIGSRNAKYKHHKIYWYPFIRFNVPSTTKHKFPTLKDLGNTNTEQRAYKTEKNKRL